jgi:hypothetical protein
VRVMTVMVPWDNVGQCFAATITCVSVSLAKRISPAPIVFVLESSVCNPYRTKCARTLLKNSPTGRNAYPSRSSNPLVLLTLCVEQAFACFPGGPALEAKYEEVRRSVGKVG